MVTHLSSAGATYTLDWISGTSAAPVYTVGGATLVRTGGAWAQPLGNNVQPQSAPNSGASACGATPCPIETQDAQIRSAPVYRGGFIYYAQTIGLPSGGLTHTAAQWTKITTAGSPPSGTFSDGGRIEDPTATSTNGGKWYDNVHIAVNSVHDFMVGYTQFASNQHPSSGYSYHDHADAAGSIRDPLIYKAGEDYYHKTFSTTTGRNRWGDFSTCQVDPSDDQSLWTLQEYGKTRPGTDDGNTGSNSSKWSNYWAKLTLYTITASAGANGTISPNGITTVVSGGSQTYTITPNACYSVASVLVDGVSQGAITSFTFNNVTANHTISATFSLNTFTITASAGSGGTISPSGSVVVNCGANQTFTITPDACHTINTVLVDGVSQGAISSFTFTNVQAAHTISASFNLKTFTITASAGSGGTISPSGSVVVNCGANQTFTISPDACHTIANVLVDGVSQGAISSFTFTNVTAAHTISASFNLINYTITASAGAGGTISPSGAVTVGCGANQTFSISPDACHTIADVLVDGVSQGAISSFTFTNVTANHTISASFNLKTFNITASAGSGGTISPSGTVTVNCGANQTFTISPDACHTIANVLVDGVSQGAISSFTFTNVTATHTISASFNLINYTITASAGAGGTISPSGSVTVGCGSNQTFTISPDACHTIADVKVDGVSQGAISSFTFTNVTANHTIAATFNLINYTITASAGAGGTISPSGSVTVGCGSNQTFSISPSDKCHVIADVVVDGVSQGAISSFTFTNVTANHTIAASFTQLGPYTITASAGAGGTISPNGATTVACGGSQTYSIAPDDKCHVIADVKVDGSSVGAVSTYTFTDVQANHTISASFTLLGPYTITASAGAGGTISPSGATTVACGGSQTYSISPADKCHVIGDVLVDGSSVGAVSTYTFTDVQANHTISASFTLLGPYTITASAGAGGTISPTGATTVACGGSQTYSIAPSDKCHAILDVKVDGVSVGAVGSYTFSDVQANHSIDATFYELGPFKITSTAGQGGTISPDGSTTVVCGGSQTYSIAPSDKCHAILDVKVDGVSVGAVGSYTFSDVQANHSIDATFYELGPFKITATAGPGGTISPDGSTTVACGGSQTYSIAPSDKCHAILDVKVDGVSVGAVGSYTFSDVQANHSIDATFYELGPFKITSTAGPGGTISPNGSTTVACGGSQTYVIAASDKCHAIADVKVDGVSVGAVASYTFSDVQTNHTIDATFSTFGPFTITASAGAGGTISPSGAVSVNCGDNQSFTISPSDKCHVINDVKVDGVSQGAIGSYTFTDVQANHTISASFTLLTYTITATAGSGGTISPSGAVVVNCGDDQTFTISPSDKCHVIADVKVDGVSVGAVSTYTFSDVQANHTIDATFSLLTYTITASAGPNGSINPSGAVVVNCGDDQAFTITPNACYHVLDVLVDGVSVGAVTSYTFTHVQANHTIAASFAPNALSTTAVTNLAAAQVRTGNDGDGTTKITITYTTPAGAASVEVWRKGFGSYPTYDDGGGSVPPAPGSYPPAGWTLTGVTASGQADEPATRDYWYYVAYAKDACGNVAPVSNETGGTLGYHLGDVSDGITPGQGNNVVNTADVSLLGSHYGLSGAALVPFNYLDVGPTTDHSVNGRPTTDGRTDFEDLVMFALNYFPHASQPALRTGPRPAAARASNLIAVHAPSVVNAGDVFEAELWLAGSGSLQAISAQLAWNSGVAEVIDAAAGQWFTAQDGVMFSPGPGGVDAALLGAREVGITGDGVLATVRFRAVASGDPGLMVDQVTGRDASNEPVAVAIGTPLAVRPPVTTTMLAPIIPNPTRGTSFLAYTLAKSGPVELAIYSVDGRRVRTLVTGVQETGRYETTWDGTDDQGGVLRSGVFYVRLQAADKHLSRRLTLVR